MAFYRTQLQLIRRLSKNNINLILIDNDNIINFNNDYYFSSEYYNPYSVTSFSNDIANKFIQKMISINSSKYIFNIDQLYNSTNINLNTKSGLILLHQYRISDLQVTTDILSYIIDIEIIRLFYNNLYNTYINENKLKSLINKPLYNNDINYIDYILINYLNIPNSNSDILNIIFFYRTFPIFNYIMYILNNKYLKIKLYKNIKYDFDFSNIDNINIFDITFLNIIYNDRIDLYMMNINKLLNNNYNILDYVFNYPEYVINEEEINIILNNILDPNFTITIDNDRAELLDAFSYIILQEIGIIGGRLNSEIYIRFSEMLSKKKLPKKINISKMISNKRKNEIISYYGLTPLLVRGILRLFIEICNILICFNASYDTDPIYADNNIKNFDNILDEDTLNKISDDLHYINLDILSKYYDKHIINEYDILSPIIFTNEDIKKNIYYAAMNDDSIYIIKQIINQNDIVKDMLSLIKKFLNTLKYLSVIISNDNYKLLLFLLFSNNKIKLIVEPPDNKLMNSFINIYHSRYDIYVTGLRNK